MTRIPESNISTPPSPDVAWVLDDDVMRLRVSGDALCYPLSASEVDTSEGYVVGDGACDISLGPGGPLVARKHARIFRHGGRWYVRALAAHHELLVDGVKRDFARLTPGMQLQMGQRVLVAESRRFVELRTFLARLLGWGWNDEPAHAVEEALQVLRGAVKRREAVWLAAADEAELRSLSSALHRLLAGPDAPLWVFDGKALSLGAPERADLEAQWKVAKMPGTLCVMARGARAWRPRGLPAFLRTLHPGDAPVALCFVLTTHRALALARGERSLCVPPLATRTPEQVAHVVREYFLDETAALGQPRLPTAQEHAWLMQCAGSFATVADAAARLARGFQEAPNLMPPAAGGATAPARASMPGLQIWRRWTKRWAQR